jgi:hypothetical protein
VGRLTVATGTATGTANGTTVSPLEIATARLEFTTTLRCRQFPAAAASSVAAEVQINANGTSNDFME